MLVALCVQLDIVGGAVAVGNTMTLGQLAPEIITACRTLTKACWNSMRAFDIVVWDTPGIKSMYAAYQQSSE